jgi:hypothetical protein
MIRYPQDNPEIYSNRSCRVLMMSSNAKIPLIDSCDKNGIREYCGSPNHELQ